MPRRGGVKVRQVMPDPVTGSTVVTKIINKIMWDGKKSKAEHIMYGALDIVEKAIGEPGVQVLEKAIQNVTPILEVRPRRVGGAVYQIPIEVEPRRGLALAIRWIVEAARARTGKSMKENLAQEIIDGYRGIGTAIKKREDMHKMAEANRAFAHYRW
ncbi:30S ribosomal protein S7 [Thermodesulfobium sp.]|jgi:small subunit ribosomal protein S7